MEWVTGEEMGRWEKHTTKRRKRRNFAELDRLNSVTEVSMFSPWLQTNTTTMLFQITFVGGNSCTRLLHSGIAANKTERVLYCTSSCQTKLVSGRI